MRILISESIEDFNKFSAGSSGIKTDIKWGTGKREYLKAFIRQIALQSAVEALSKGIGNVNFRFSYPTAFSKKHKTALDNAMRMALEELSKVSPAINSAHELEPEAMASTYFYAIPPQIKGYNIQKAAFTDGVVILDIGGGTSDISIIEGEKNEFKFKTSLKFAGREIFLKPLLQNVDFLKLFGVDEESINKIKELTGGADITSSAYTQADALIRSKSDSILNVLNNNYDKPEFVDFVQLIRIAIAGIFYYIGMIIKNLKDEGIYKSQRIPTVYVGGNGAKMFHWLAQGNYKNTDNALFQSTLMNEIFNPKLKYEPMRFDPETSEPNLKIYLTPTYMSKPEVAYGLVVDRNAKNVPVLNNTNLKDAFIAGEDFKIKTPASEDEKETISEKTYSDVVNRDDLKNMLTADGEISNDMFKKFLKVFDSCSEEVDIPKITPPQSKIEMMNSALRQDLNTLINKIKQDSTMADEIQDEHVIFINELI